MQRECEAHNMELPPEAFVYLIQRHYFSQNRPLRACHPRDILDQIQDISSYLGIRPTLSKQLLDAAVESYFADI